MNGNCWGGGGGGGGGGSIDRWCSTCRSSVLGGGKGAKF